MSVWQSSPSSSRSGSVSSLAPERATRSSREESIVCSWASKNSAGGARREREVKPSLRPRRVWSPDSERITGIQLSVATCGFVDSGGSWLGRRGGSGEASAGCCRHSHAIRSQSKRATSISAVERESS
eukprot:3235023-Pleurochrysis_carterae.AAC.1